MLRIFPCLAHHNLDDFAILSEVVWATQGVQQVVLSDGRRETCHVDEVLLDNAEPSEMLTAQGVSLGLLGLLLPLLSILLRLLGYLLLVLGHPGLVSSEHARCRAEGQRTPRG